MRNKILLIYPKTGVDPEKPHPPHSLLSLAGPLEQLGYRPVIVDARVEKNYKEKIRQNLPDSILAGISSMTGFQIEHALRICEFIRQHDQHILLVWGGVHPTFMPEQTCRNKYVDVVVKGEGELILPQIVKRVQSRQSLEGVPCITYKDRQGNILNSDTKPLLMDLNQIPMTPWHLVDIEKYFRPEYGVDKTITLVTSKGCPHRCTFCYNLNFNMRKWRGKDARHVVDEIQFLRQRYGIQGVYFIEDNFFANKKRVEEICEMLIRRKLDIVWGSSNRVDYVARYDEEFMRLLKRSGCRNFLFGVESGSDVILQLISKDITKKDIMSAVDKCRKYGIVGVFTFISGLPGETKDDLNRTIELIDEIKSRNEDAEISGLFTYVPYPGTPMYELAIRKGLLPPRNLEGWAKYNFFSTSSEMVWLPEEGRRLRKYLSFIVRFAFYDQRIAKSFSKTSYRIAFWVLRFMAKLRWKLRFFALPIEWYLLEKKYNAMALE
jgi:radical SAM superfamily enzyme YgiQ (UPF0313 family)